MNVRMSARLILILTLFTTFLPMASVRAQDAPGVVSDTEYISPLFGYSLEWSDNWQVNEAETVSDDNGRDVLKLEEGTTSSTYIGQAIDGQTPAQALDAYLAEEGLTEEVSGADYERESPMAVINTGKRALAIQALEAPEAEAMLIAVYDMVLEDYPDEVDRISEEIRIFDRTTDANATADASPSAASYTSPTYGFTIPAADYGWEVAEEFPSGHDNEGVILSGELGLMSIAGTDIYGTDVSACVSGEASRRRGSEGISNWHAADSEKWTEIIVEENNIATAEVVFQVESDSGNDVIDMRGYFECRVIPGQDATIALFTSEAEDRYQQHRDASLELFNAVTFGDDIATPAATATAAPAVTPAPTTAATPAGDGPDVAYSYTVTIPAGFEPVVDSSAPAGGPMVLESDISTVTIMQDQSVGSDVEACLDVAASTVEDRDPLLIDTDVEGGVATAEYSLDYGDNTMLAHCQVLSPDKAVLITTVVVAADDVDAGREELQQILDAIEIDVP